MTEREHRLSKSRFVAGWQCPKLLWWTVNEPGAPELQPGIVLEDLFNQGILVGERARQEWPDGVLVEGSHRDPGRVQRTRAALDGGAGVLFEATFVEDGVWCAVDVLERTADGWTVIEVKSSSSVKDYHYPDLAVQVHVARKAGLAVTRIEVMRLNKEYRLGGAEPLFRREEVSAEVEPLVKDVPRRIAEQMAVLRLSAVPAHEVGRHCWFRGNDKPCAFFGRCWPEDADHIGNLVGVGPVKTCDFLAAGVATMAQLPAGEKLNVKQKRQLKAQREGRLIVEPGLREALMPVATARRLGFLDFETVQRALPPWEDLGPWHNTAAQFSYHERGPDGTMTHAEYLAEGPEDPAEPPADPREPLARAMLAATAGADRIVMYTTFEKTQISALAKHLPHLEQELTLLRDKLWDLHPVVAEHVYHPDFLGSFSLKDVLTPLVPDETYGDDMLIVDGKTASVQIARLLFTSGRIPKAERETTRRALLEYCKKDTYATVRLVGRLAELAAGG